MTSPIAPARTSSSARVTARTSKRSVKLTVQMRAVSRCSAAHALELVERRDARLVRHEVLAGAHRLDREVGALVEHGRAGDEADRRVVEQRAPVGDARHVREALDESLERLRDRRRSSTRRRSRRRR
jgi:hypothetical protein